MTTLQSKDSKSEDFENKDSEATKVHSKDSDEEGLKDIPGEKYGSFQRL